MISTVKIDTPEGEMIVGATEEGICLLEFTDRKILHSEYKELMGILKTDIVERENNHIVELRKQLEEYFKGRRKIFQLPLVTPGTEFQNQVWRELLNIPYGETRSYREQAEAIGSKGSVRAVANENGRNRIAIIIPCHRVIGSDGHLTGYGGGLKRKRRLLDHEKKYSGKAIDISLF